MFRAFTPLRTNFMLFKQLSFYLAVAGICGGVYLVKRLQYQPPPPPPYQEPARSPFAYAVAATGILEATRENVRIGATKSGLVQKVFVGVGSKVKTGDPLMQLDNREATARLETARSQLEVLQATVRTEEVQRADANDQLARIIKLEKSNVATEEEKTRKQFLVDASTARLGKIKADIKALESQIRQVETELEILTVRAPRDGTILQVNTRAGEYANVTSVEPWIILGDVDTLQIRADVDEQDAPLVQPNQSAFAFLKGDTKNKIPIRFVRIEPYVVPKRSLTGDSAERVDTRVLQIIFEMDRPQTPIYVGQQVDVYIQRPEPMKTAQK